MSERYKIHDPEGIHFVTLTVVDWVDAFTRKEYIYTFMESLEYCQQHKGLVVYAYVVMPSHVHLLISAEDGANLSSIIRDLKKYTSQKILKQILEGPESRREWMLHRFDFAGRPLQRITNFKFWQDGFHPKACGTYPFLKQKLDYIHNNPVEAEIVDEPWHFRYSSAKDYSGMQGMLKIVLID